MRRSLGTAMLWGCFGVTLFGIFLTPVFFYVVRRFSDRGPAKPVRERRADAAPAGTTRNGTVAATPSYSHALPDGRELDTRAKP